MQYFLIVIVVLCIDLIWHKCALENSGHVFYLLHSWKTINYNYDLSYVLPWCRTKDIDIVLHLHINSFLFLLWETTKTNLKRLVSRPWIINVVWHRIATNLRRDNPSIPTHFIAPYVTFVQANARLPLLTAIAKCRNWQRPPPFSSRFRFLNVNISNLNL